MYSCSIYQFTSIVFVELGAFKKNREKRKRRERKKRKKERKKNQK